MVVVGVNGFSLKIARYLNILEKIQERGLRFIYRDYSGAYEELLSRANIPSLEIKRIRNMAMETFRILYGLSPKCIQNLISFKERSINFRHILSVKIPMIKTTKYGKQSFRYTAAVLWNELPEHIRSTSDFDVFKNLVSRWEGDHCQCVACMNL